MGPVTVGVGSSAPGSIVLLAAQLQKKTLVRGAQPWEVQRLRGDVFPLSCCCSWECSRPQNVQRMVRSHAMSCCLSCILKE